VQVTFLGTGTSQGVPIIACTCDVCRSEDPKDKRLRTSILVETEGRTFVIDTGPDFRQQMLRENVGDLDGVIFTHEHKDHTAGFDDIRPYNFIHKKKIDVYASQRVQDALKREFAYIFSDSKYPGIPEVNMHLIGTEPLKIKGVEVIPIQVMHHKLPVLGFRFGDLSYITDANFISETEKEKVKGSKVLVLNALRREDHISHFSFQQAIDLSLELGAEKTYFIHISHQLGKHADVSLELPPEIELAWDGLKIIL
jgi:phosphoribosyl 1,2-cyclic phosphate phosphodiesterase